MAVAGRESASGQSLPQVWQDFAGLACRIRAHSVKSSQSVLPDTL
jgi:hypothetical protein